MKIPVSKAYAKWMDEDAERLNAMAELARKVAVTLPTREEAEKRAFCPTGRGGGVKNDCSSAGGDQAEAVSVGEVEVQKTSYPEDDHVARQVAIASKYAESLGVSDPVAAFRKASGSQPPLEGEARKAVNSYVSGGWMSDKVIKELSPLAESPIEASGVTFMRGLRLYGDSFSRILSARRVSHDTPASWTTDPRVAARFGSAPNPDTESKNVVLVLRGASRGLAVTRPGTADDWGEREFILPRGAVEIEKHVVAKATGGGEVHFLHVREKSSRSVGVLAIQPSSDSRFVGEVRPVVSERAFCPTGEGGGVKNDCPPGGSASPSRPDRKLKGEAAMKAKSEVEKLAQGEKGSVPADHPLLINRVAFRPAGDKPNSQFAKVPSDDELRKAMGGNAVADAKDSERTNIGGVSGKSINKNESWIGFHRDLPEGTPVAFRIDIPTFNATKGSGKPVYAVTIHEDDKKGGSAVGKRIGYDGIARMSGPVSFSTEGKEKNAMMIAAGVAGKSPIATVKGKFNPSREVPADVDSWTAVGYDPQKTAYFYDKKTGREITGGTDAVSVGNTVFTRQPKYGKRNAKTHYRSVAEMRAVGSWGIDTRAFCPTGEGGGVKNDCSPSDGGSSSDGGSTPTATAEKPASSLFSSNENKSWFPVYGDEPFPGASRYADIKVSSGRSVAKSLDSMGIKPEDAVSLLGAPARSSVFIRPAPEFGQKFYAFSGTNTPPVFMGFEADVAGVRGGLEGTYVLGSRKNNDTGKQDLVLYGNVMDVMPTVSATAEGRHAAARAFYRSMVSGIENARKAGVSTVMFSAAGNSTDSSRPGALKGYTIWPRMGFDGPLPQHIRSKLPEDLSHARTLMDLHATREGTRWWAKNGEDIDVELNLADRNSPQNKVFDRFVKHFSRDRRDLPLGEGDGWLSPEDLARLDEMWAEIWDEEDILDDYDGGEQKFVAESRSADCGRDDSGRFGQGNKCQEDGDVGPRPASVSTYESIAIQRDADRISRSAATGDVQSLRSAVEIAMERSTPNQIAKSLGFSDFDQDGSMSDALKRPVSLSQSLASTRKSAAVSHLVSLASAASFVPEIKQVPIDFDSFDSWTSRISKEHGVAKSAFKGFIAACDLTNGRVTAMFDVPPGDDRRLRNYEGNIHSTDHPAHYIVHEYAHTLQSGGVRQALIDEREQSLKYTQGADAASDQRRSELESDISRLKSGGNLTENEISSYVQGARLVSMDLESEDMKSFLSSHYRSILASGSTDDVYAASRLDYLSSDESSGLNFRPDDSEFGLWSEGRQKFAADNPDSWTAASRNVSLYGSTSELELAAEYFTAVTLGYKKNVDVLDRFCERLHMPRPQQKVPDSASPRKKAAKKLRL